MTLNDLCKFFNWSEIVDNQMDIDKDHYSIGEDIYTDADEIKSNITEEGYIHISSVINSTYIMYIDRHHRTSLCIYKYIPETKFKEIIEKVNMLDEINKEIKHSSANVCDIHHTTHWYDNRAYTHNNTNSNGIIDINTFTCTECDSEEKMMFIRSTNNPDILECKCDKCQTEYTFTPSKYYKLASKRVIYFKSEESSRLVDITENSKKKEIIPKQSKTT